MNSLSNFKLEHDQERPAIKLWSDILPFCGKMFSSPAPDWYFDDLWCSKGDDGQEEVSIWQATAILVLALAS